MRISKKVKQIGSLYSATLLNMVLGVGISIFTTRLLGTNEYGNYKFFQSIFNLVFVIVSFGVFYSISRMLALEKCVTNTKRLYGVYVLFTLFLGFFSVLIIVGFSFFQADYFEYDLSKIFLYNSVLIIPFILSSSLVPILQGGNNIGLLSLLRILPSLTFLVILFFHKSLTLEEAILFFYGAFAVYAIGIIIYLKPEFKNISSVYYNVKVEIKDFGLKVYLGSLFNVASASLGAILVSYFVDNTAVGYFTLAITISSPLLIIPTVVGTAYFKSFATSQRVDRKILVVTVCITILCYLIFYLLIEPVVQLFYGAEYEVIIGYSRVIALGSIMHGFGDLFNRFLYAKGEGKIIRNGAMLVGVFNIIAYFIFVKFVGINGAILTKVIGGAMYFSAMILGYKILLKKNSII